MERVARANATAGRVAAGRRTGPSPEVVICAAAFAALAVLAAALHALDDLARRWDREDRVLMIRQAALADLDAIDRAAGAQRPASLRHSPDVVRRDLATALRARSDDLERRGQRALATATSVAMLACLFATLAPWAWPATGPRRPRTPQVPGQANGQGWSNADAEARAVAGCDADPPASHGMPPLAGAGFTAPGLRPASDAALGHAVPMRARLAHDGSEPGAATARGAGLRMRALLDRIGTAAALDRTAADARPAAGKS